VKISRKSIWKIFGTKMLRDKQTNNDKNISSLAEAITKGGKGKGNLICIELYYELLISKVLRYGRC